MTVTAPYFAVVVTPHLDQLLANALFVPVKPASRITQLMNDAHHGTSSV
jgi:hypothetical protein